MGMDKERVSIQGIWLYLKPFTTKVLNFGTWALIALLAFNYAWAPWPLTSNLFYDFLTTRTGGPLLYANHVSTTLMIVFVAAVACYRAGNEAYKQIWVVLSVVSIHELLLGYIMLPITNFYWVLNLRWVFWLSIILVGGWYFASKSERHRIKRVFVIIFLYMVLWESFLFATHIDYRTIIEFAPGPAFSNPIDNALEIGSWYVPYAYWAGGMDWRIKGIHPQNWVRYFLFYRNQPVPIEMPPMNKLAWFKESGEWEKEYIPKGGVQGKVVLDVGAGAGETAYFFFAHGASKVICVEPDQKAVAMLERNAAKLGWNVEILARPFTIADLGLPFDFMKLDAEQAGDTVMLQYFGKLPPLAMEIHSKEAADTLKARYPNLRVYKKYHWPFNTWFGVNDDR
jgi:hypothetical protein